MTTARADLGCLRIYDLTETSICHL